MYQGEERAAEILRKQGFEILSCNFNFRIGELDIVALKLDARGHFHFHFVEVKYWKYLDFDFHPLNAIPAQKWKTYAIGSKIWLAKNPPSSFKKQNSSPTNSEAYVHIDLLVISKQDQTWQYYPDVWPP